MNVRSARSTLLVLALVPLLGCEFLDPSSDDSRGDGDGSGEPAAVPQVVDPGPDDPNVVSADGGLTSVEDALLGHISNERADAGLPVLSRDPGLDAIMLAQVRYMAEVSELTHADGEGRRAEARVRFYSGDDGVRCSEIIQWWGNTPNGRIHYQGYYNSPPHHSAYMEEGLFNLGGTETAGVAVIEATGPAGSSFEGRDGSYSGVVFCDHGVELAVDPLE